MTPPPWGSLLSVFPVTPLFLSRNLEGIFELKRRPSRFLNLDRLLLLEFYQDATRRQVQANVLTYLIVCLYEKPPFLALCPWLQNSNRIELSGPVSCNPSDIMDLLFEAASNANGNNGGNLPLGKRKRRKGRKRNKQKSQNKNRVDRKARKKQRRIRLKGPSFGDKIKDVLIYY